MPGAEHTRLNLSSFSSKVVQGRCTRHRWLQFVYFAVRDVITIGYLVNHLENGYVQGPVLPAAQLPS